ncbi:whirlin, partial [Biomphalaria pfeifferi]
EAGLEVGDHIIRANGVDLRCVANSGAVKVLSSSALLNLVVIHRGKVPEWKVAKERVL